MTQLALNLPGDPAPDITVEPDGWLGFVARPVVLRKGYVVVTGCHARTAEEAAGGLRRHLKAGEK